MINNLCHAIIDILLTSFVLLNILGFPVGEFLQCTIKDDGQTNIDIDLHGDSDWLCEGTTQWSEENLTKQSYQTSSRLSMRHICMDQEINGYEPDEIPNSGPHRSAYAAYGEYKFVPPGRYIHNLEHGAVVFMYHPCAPESGKETLRKLAKACTWKHLITAYGRPGLNQTYPYAIVTYGHVYHASIINTTDVARWIRGNSKVLEDENEQGTFNHTLLSLSQAPSDPSSAVMCPEEITMKPETSALNKTEQNDDEQTYPTPVDLNTPAIDTVTIKSTLHNLHSSSPKAITTTLSSTTTKTATTLTIKKTTLSTTSTTTSTELASNDTSSAASKQYLTSEPVETSSITAASSETGATPRTDEVSWAIGSLLFIVCVLALAVWKTKLLRRRAYGNDIETSKIWRDNSAPGSFSVAAIIRKLPDVITRPNQISGKNGRYEENTTYSLIKDDETSSDDEL